MATPTGRVIEGNVAAGAGSASVAVNRATEAIPAGPAVPALPEPFYYREQQHSRVLPTRASDEIVLNVHALIERIHEGGPWPEGVARFQGIGQVNGETPIGRINRAYRFDIPAHTLDEAWSNFDAASQRGAAQATEQVRAEVRQELHRRAQAQGGLVVPNPMQTAALLGADGRPVGGG